MPLFTHVESGFAVDVLEFPDVYMYRKIFAPDLLEKFVIVQAPEGTLPGAKYANEVFTNPQPATLSVPEPAYFALTKDQFTQLYADNNADISATLKNWPMG